jgi:putative nucleotidyltransferase with HDIG domain
MKNGQTEERTVKPVKPARPDIESLAVVLQRLPPLPQVISQALALMRRQDVGRQQVAKVLAVDESITSVCLRMVNSAYYSLPRRVTSLGEAIGYLGFDTVSEIICMASTTKLFVRSIPAYMLDRTALWRHSAAVAAGSDWIARKRGLQPVSELYVAGLLHDIGKLAVDLMQKHAVQWQTPTGETNEELDWLEIETASIGRNHAEIGGMLAQRWNLPDRVAEAIACHHAPNMAKEDPMFASAVHVANVAAVMCGIGVGVSGLRTTLDAMAVRRLGFTERDTGELMLVIVDAVEKAEDMLGFNV